MFASLMAPLKRGNAAEFWSIVGNVGKNRWADYLVETNAYACPDDDAVAYVVTGLHSSTTYALPLAEAQASLRAATDDLERRSAGGETSWQVEGYRRWRDDPDVRVRDLAALVASCDAARRDYIFAKHGSDLVAYDAERALAFAEQWRRRRWYWATIMFEWALFTALALWAVWPAIRRGSPWRWAWHLGGLPLLFLLPVFLGYATMTFTSAGPSGGVVYPWLVVWLRGGTMTNLDRWVLERLPPVLETLSTPTGDWIVLTGYGMPAPTQVLGVSLAIGVFVALAVAPLRRRKGAGPAKS
jgi:hypothetical protein